MASAIKKRTITRNRETLTCLPCRSKKLKCDKALPCSSCTKRGEADSCSYAKRPERKEQAEQSKSAKAEERLQHLEQLLETYASNGSVPNETTHSEEENGGPFTNGTATYIGATHFSAMLEDIEELRQVLVEEEPGTAASPPTNDKIADETDILFGGRPRQPLQWVLANHLPPRVEVDRRLAAYFRAEAIAAPCIHTPQFMRQYERFWQDRSSVSPLWISMLFSILHLSRNVGRARLYDESPGDGDKHNFSLAATHCLAIGRYSRPQPLAVEALAVYIQAKVIETLDPSLDLGILFGTLVQLAYAMGYHREPDHFKHLSAFEGEMRRRTWSFAMQLDLLVSFQLGLPNNVQFGSWDSRPPSNLKDEDFDEDSPALPSPRPPHEPTKTTFYTAKHMLMTVFDKILKHALAAGQSRSEEELIALDSELKKRYETIPAVLHYRSISTSLTDPAYIVITRKCVELLYQKCRCVLHRKHVTTGRLESIRICYEAASQIVDAFLEMYPELKPGGQFFDDRWLLGSITWNDWLLAVMVMCLLICQTRRAAVPGLDSEEQQSLLRMLKLSLDICNEKADESTAARRTKRILEAILYSCQEPTPNGARTVQPDLTTASTSEPTNSLINASGPSNGLMSMPNIVETDMSDFTQGWSDPWLNVFDTQEWNFLEESLNNNFEVQ